MFLNKPKSYTWDACYIINEIINGGDEHPYEFDVLNQSIFYVPEREPTPSPLQFEEQMYC